MKEKETNIRLYPIFYKGKMWKESDCNGSFTGSYLHPFALNLDCGVYLGEGLWIYPDGKIEEY